MATHSSNEYLNERQMWGNAKYIILYFEDLGWTTQAIAAMLGNMERESTINPGLWQNMDEGNLSGGLGLVQWTPASKLINWCDQWGLDYLSIEAQCMRIYYEFENGLQWIPTNAFPESFEEFSQSEEDVAYLTECFLKNYERAGVEALDERIENAEYWEYSIEHWVRPDEGEEDDDDPIEPEPEPEPIKKKKSHYKFHLFNKRRRLF